MRITLIYNTGEMHSMQAYRHTLHTCIAVYGSQQIHCKYLADMAWILTFGKLPNYSVTESGFVIQFPVNNMHMCIPVHVHIPNSIKQTTQCTFKITALLCIFRILESKE